MRQTLLGTAGRSFHGSAATQQSDMVREMSRRTQDLSGFFDTLDSDKEGKITKDQFTHAMRNVGMPQLRTLVQSLARNELSGTPTASTDDEDEAVAQLIAEDTNVKQEDFGTMIMNRFRVTLEVAVSKIFPAGFGWQGASVIAGNQGFADTSLSFALTTGLGDGVGVLVGHTGYFAIKKMVYDGSINLAHQFQTGVLLGSAAFCSGTVWQPVVNFLSGTAQLGFNQTLAGTFVCCGTAFYVGLRGGRLIYAPLFAGVEKPTYGNLKADAALSVSIGGATGAFVGTDVSFGDANWLRGVVGVEDSMSDQTGMILAGSSTALGFSVIQSMQNVSYMQGKNWVD